HHLIRRHHIAPARREAHVRRQDHAGPDRPGQDQHIARPRAALAHRRLRQPRDREADGQFGAEARMPARKLRPGGAQHRAGFSQDFGERRGLQRCAHRRQDDLG
ncbi:hypothetical protein RZS08_02925, partial [Arthrospira platensis SPKY1]|nr:hypothetical protein [Arthrospira platensis SPKY1]